MLRNRVIPCLLVDDGGLYKTVRFKDPAYVGDPINAIRIFNEKEVDELILLDIGASRYGRSPDFGLISEVANECFMPLGYGGGIQTIDQIRRLFRIGIEKVCVNTSACETPQLVRDASQMFGSQSIMVSIDVKRGFLGNYQMFTHGGTRKRPADPVVFAQEMQNMGAGEILLTSIDQDGTREGYDLEITRRVSDAVEIPVVACGGAGSVQDMARVTKETRASAVAAGSLFVFYGPNRAVLISYPTADQLARL